MQYSFYPPSSYMSLWTKAIALEMMSLSFQHVFSSEIDMRTRNVLMAAHGNLMVLHGDITEPRETVPVTLYTAGFPCQTFSLAGKQAGLEDQRGCVFLSNLEYISENRPDSFVLENVENIQAFQTEFAFILKTLAGLRDKRGLPEYSVYHQVPALEIT